MRRRTWRTKKKRQENFDRHRGISPACRENTSVKDSHVLVLQENDNHDARRLKHYIECVFLAPRQLTPIEQREPTFRCPSPVGWGCSGLVRCCWAGGCCCVGSTCRFVPGIAAQDKRSRCLVRQEKEGLAGRVIASPWQTCEGFRWRLRCLQTGCGLRLWGAQESAVGRRRWGVM